MSFNDDDHIAAWWHGGTVVSTVTSQQEGLGLNPLSGCGPSVWSFHVLPICGGTQASSHRSNMQVRLIGNCKLSVGVNGCLSVC